jgi:hypothetical protein
MLEFGDNVDVYRNLRTGGFSVRKKGKVVIRCNALIMLDPRFIVSEKGRQRVLEKKVKNVHAFIRGTFYLSSDSLYAGLKKEAYYNPYITETFIDKVTGEPIHEAMFALMIDGKAYYIPKDDDYV